MGTQLIKAFLRFYHFFSHPFIKKIAGGGRVIMLDLKKELPYFLTSDHYKLFEIRKTKPKIRLISMELY